MNDNEPEPPPSDEQRDIGMAAVEVAADAGAELAGGFIRILFGVVCIATLALFAPFIPGCDFA